MMKLATLFLLGILAWTGLSPARAETPNVPYSTNLKADAELAKSRGVPIMVMFGSPHCPYCERLLSEFLLPMQRNPEYAKKVLMRRVEVGSTQSLIDFNGKPTTQGDFAKLHQIGLSPTVVVFDYRGNPASAPLIGLGTVDYYGAFLDAAIDAGLTKVASNKSPQRLN
ncbi:hypothetical protein SFMTTN_2566 [Sulfuriferula multivorans]|uniref:Thioredoxin domain-containing protein n=1 Tax=Sulfuriferula multivorans TaxID=1559896 RepID=A0A401JGH1_9PROT|nr:thioredoxin family protein [Sulfuriferula multivorans]GBL46741.1 hypothetical protein SFMTTN_2566 [Sulfuriferula multivorans]